MTWEVRAVDQTGALVSIVDGVNVVNEHREVNGVEYVDCTIGTLEPDATYFALFSHEIQFWLDGDLRFWGRPARIDASRESTSDQLAIRVDGLFSYFFDEVVGGEKVNHVVSPHEDLAAVGALPNSWEASSDVDLHAVVDNNWEFWSAQKAIQVNNNDAGQDAYIWQRYGPVPAELAGVPFAAAATCYISDDEGGSIPWGGPAYNERGLGIHRLDGTTFEPTSGFKSAKIDDDTPRKALVRLQTREVVPQEGEYIEVRLYAPAAWTAWRWVGLFDGRWEGADGTQKGDAVALLVEHAQDATVGKQDRNIGTDVASLGETTNKVWPWWRRDNIGEQIQDLADTFEFDVDVAAETGSGEWNDGAYDEGTFDSTASRTIRVRRLVGTNRTAEDPLTKTAFVGWSLGAEVTASASRVIIQGDGIGPARDEWWVDDPTALNGNVREFLDFAAPGATLAQLQDNAEVELARRGNIDKLPRARIVGARAVEARPGDRYTVDLDHGAAQFTGEARAMAVDFDCVTKVATLHLEPVE